jgi:hypothetical protein
MDWHAKKFRQPIAPAESPPCGERGVHPYEGNRAHPKDARLDMGQLRRLQKPTSHCRDGWSTLR